MKITWNGMEIECTPDEFEELYARGILTNKHNGEESLQDLYNLPKEEHNERNIPKITIKDWDSPKQKDPFPTVAVYGCYMPNNNDLIFSTKDYSMQQYPENWKDYCAGTTTDSLDLAAGKQHQYKDNTQDSTSKQKGDAPDDTASNK